MLTIWLAFCSNLNAMAKHDCRSCRLRLLEEEARVKNAGASCWSAALYRRLTTKWLVRQSILYHYKCIAWWLIACSVLWLFYTPVFRYHFYSLYQNSLKYSMHFIRQMHSDDDILLWYFICSSNSFLHYEVFSFILDDMIYWYDTIILRYSLYWWCHCLIQYFFWEKAVCLFVTVLGLWPALYILFLYVSGNFDCLLSWEVVTLLLFCITRGWRKLILILWLLFYVLHCNYLLMYHSDPWKCWCSWRPLFIQKPLQNTLASEVFWFRLSCHLQSWETVYCRFSDDRVVFYHYPSFLIPDSDNKFSCQRLLLCDNILITWETLIIFVCISCHSLPTCCDTLHGILSSFAFSAGIWKSWRLTIWPGEFLVIISVLPHCCDWYLYSFPCVDDGLKHRRQAQRAWNAHYSDILHYSADMY